MERLFELPCNRSNFSVTFLRNSPSLFSVYITSLTRDKYPWSTPDLQRRLADVTNLTPTLLTRILIT